MKAPKNKKILFFIQIMKYVGMLAVFTVVTLFLYFGTDTLCNLLYRWTGKENFSQEYIRTKLLQVVMEGSARQRIMESETNVNNFSVHPYTGYVTNIDMPSDNIVNRFGWIGPDPLKIHDENTVTVFVTGGSFALGLYLQSGDLLKQLLEELPMYQGKQILVTSVALGGYKQPQQLLALQYLMALGAQIDLVINIDGYNEVVLPKVESIPFGITPSYPRSWKFIADKIVRPGFPDKQKIYDQLWYLRVENARLWNQRSIWNHMVPLMLWNIIDTGLERGLLSLDVRVSEISGVKVKKYEWIGPDLEDQGTYDNQLLSLWKNSSLQMYRLANANNIRYIHVLQPNQYTPNVKQFSEEEGAILGAWLHRDTISHIDQDSRILLAERTVFSLYPRLENEGQNLRILYGVPFIDATHIYDEESRTIYIDRCCHVNEVGSDMIVHLIVDALKKEY